MCEYSRSRSFHDDLILQDQASGERSQDQWSSGFNFGGPLGNMQIRWCRSHFSACQHWFLDSAYPNTHKSDLKPFLYLHNEASFLIFCLNKVGDKLPAVDLYEGNPGNKVNTKDAFGKGKHVIFAIPGAFTPTCQKVSKLLVAFISTVK